MKLGREKIYGIEDLLQWRKKQSGNVVLTNGCFDIVHVGHLRCLEYARKLGSVLVVAINSDSSVRELKGESRPYVKEMERAELIAGLCCVDATVIFTDKRLSKVIAALRPDVYAKGGDYNIDTMDQGEREELEKCGAEIHFFNLVEGKSTTNVVKKITNLNQCSDKL